MVRAIVAIAVASRSLLATIINDPTALDALRDADALAREQPLDAFLEDAPVDPGALRRFKRREMVRIAARDLLALADLPAVARELAALAEACLHAAVEFAAPAMPFTVIG